MCKRMNSLSVSLRRIALISLWVLLNGLFSSAASGDVRLPSVLERYRLVYFDGHMHSVHSDGSGSIADIKTAALKRGLDAVIVTNHTSGVKKERSPGKTNWDVIVAECESLSEPDFLMIPSFEITGNESRACRDHVLAWGAKDPYVGDNAKQVIPEERWPSPASPQGTGPLKPESIAAWAEYVQKQGGIAVHAHPTGTTQPEYGVDLIELWNSSHVKDVYEGCLDRGFSELEAWSAGVRFNNVTTVGEDWLFETINIAGLAIPIRLTFFQSAGAWLGKSRGDRTPSGTKVHTWDDLLMMYVKGDLERPIFGVASSDAHNTAKVDFARTDAAYDHSDVGEAKNGALLQGALTEENLLDTIKGGHLFATTGPSIAFDVDGKIMGETVKVEQTAGGGNPVVSVAFEVKTETPGTLLESVRLIKDGTVVFQKSPMTTSFKSKLDHAVAADGYFRVEVRSVNSALAEAGRYPYRHAWSNPIFVDR